MTNKENALRIIRHRKPERITTGPPCESISYFGCNHEDPETGKSHDEHKVSESWKDIWGTLWVKEMEGVMAFPRGNPLAKVCDLNRFPWPDPDDVHLSGAIYEKAGRLRPGDHFVCGQNRDTLWERSYMLVGMENMMIYFYQEPEYVREILRRIMDFQIGIANHYIKAGAEMVNFSDDLGTQANLLISPAILYDFFVPEYKRLSALYKEHGILINFHSCGHIEPALELFTELGVDILNPVQATANNLANIKKATYGKMALQGGISSGLIETGPVERIVRDVKEKMALLGEGGGYFCCIDQYVPAPAEHMRALDDTVERFGAYRS